MSNVLRAALLSFCILVLANSAYAVGPTYRVEVAGLACPFCAYGIEKQLSALEGVETVEVHIRDGAVIVSLRDGATLDEAAVRQAVDDAGFTLDAFEQLSPAASQ